MSYESKINKWNNVKEEKWGEKINIISELYESKYETSSDLLIDNFLRPENHNYTEYSYDNSTKEYTVDIHKADMLFGAYEYSKDKGQDFQISGKIEVPADTDIAWNNKHYNEANERIDYSLDQRLDDDKKLYNERKISADDYDQYHLESLALEKRFYKMKSLLEDFMTQAFNSRVDGKEKNLAGVIDEYIAKNVNTIQHIANADIEKDNKLSKIQEVLNRVSLMKELEGFVLGYGGGLYEQEPNSGL